MSDSSNPAIAKPSDLGQRPAEALAAQPGASAAGGSAVAERRRDLPPPMRLDLHGGERVELVDDQVFADRVVVRAGERGIAMYPSSQAASWVVHFDRVGPKLRVIPERLLRVAQ